MRDVAVMPPSGLFLCGPARIRLSAATADLYEQTASELILYAEGGEESARQVSVHVSETAEKATMGGSNFLQCRNMHVEMTGANLYATCRSGAAGMYDAASGAWQITLPTKVLAQARREPIDVNLEDLLELVLTVAWRQAGWIPLHAGAVVHGDRCAILTAPSRGGKTSLTAAHLHLGWHTLGDDKLLLRLQRDGRPQLRSLQRHFNVDPQARKWFPEIGDLSDMPLDSAWTPKRRVAVERIWPEQFQQSATPTHLIQIQRFPDRRRTNVKPLDFPQVLSALLHQTVIPKEPAMARAILAVIAPGARQLRGVGLELGEGAYEDPQTFDLLQELAE